MTELGELERHHAEFARRNTRIVVASLEKPDQAKKTQDEFPHLVVVADAERGLSNVADAILPHSGPGGSDTDAPATLLVDRAGTVRFEYRPNLMTRLSSEELLAAIDEHLPSGR
jgi:peroxiredoxin